MRLTAATAAMIERKRAEVRLVMWFTALEEVLKTIT